MGTVSITRDAYEEQQEIDRDQARLARLIAATRALVDEWLEVGLEAMPADVVRELVPIVEAERSRIGLAFDTIIGSWSERGLWSDDGSLSAAHRLASETGQSLRTCRRRVQRAGALAGMPLACDAVIDGRITLDHLTLLARAATPERSEAFEHDEALLVSWCAGRRFADAARAITSWRHEVDRRLTGAVEPLVTSTVTLTPVSDLVVELRGELDPVSAEIVSDEIDRLVGVLKDREGAVRTAAGWRAAALVEMARRSASAPGDGVPARPLFTVIVGDHTARRLCQLASGAVVAPEHLVGHVDAAVMETVLFDGPMTVVGVSRQRSFSGVLRRAIEIRDRGCQHPSGCDVPMAKCDVDHVVPWAMRGPTTQFNGRLECATHNRRPSFHDLDGEPLPERIVTQRDVGRVRRRWRSDASDEEDIPDRIEPAVRQIGFGPQLDSVQSVAEEWRP